MPEFFRADHQDVATLLLPACLIDPQGAILQTNTCFDRFSELYRLSPPDTLQQCITQLCSEASGNDLDVDEWLTNAFQAVSSFSPLTVLHSTEEASRNSLVRVRMLSKIDKEAVVLLEVDTDPQSDQLMPWDYLEIYKFHFKRSSEPVLLADTTGVLTDCNDSVLELLQTDRRTLVGEPLAELAIFTMADMPRVLLNFSRSLGGATTEQTLALQTGSAGSVGVTWTMVPLAVHRDIRGVWISIRRASRKEQFEEALRRSEEKFRAVVDHVHEGIIVFDHTYHATYVNPALIRIFGGTRDDILGQDFRMLLPERSWRLIKDAETMRDGKAAPPQKYESEIVRGDGSRRKVEISSSLLIDSDDNILTVAEFFDITERVEAAHRIQRRLYVEEAIAAISQVFITAQRPDYIKVLTLISSAFSPTAASLLQITEDRNEVRIVMYQAEGEVGADLDTTFAHLPKAASVSFERLLRGENLVLTCEEISRTKNLGQFLRLLPETFGSVAIIPILENMHALDGFLIVAVDHPPGEWRREDLNALRVIGDMIGKHWGRERTTEKLRATEDELNQSMKMQALGQLAGGVAHDFNNLLTVITGQSDLALMLLDADHPVHKKIQDIQHSAIRGANLTRQLLAFSRTQVLASEQIDINEIVRDLLKMLHRLIGEHIHLLTNFCDDLHPILANAGQMEQVIINLVINARDAMPQGGEITIETENVLLDEKHIENDPDITQDEYVRLTVRDTGTGIPPDIVDKIFDPFFTTKEQGKGTGLGLSTVYGIVRQVNGFIEIETAVGKGAAFLVHFPKDLEQREDEETIDSEVLSLYGEESILIVEDEEDVREMAVQVLELYDYQVEFALDGVDALKKSMGRDKPFDLVITDMVMPNMGGMDLVQRLREIWPDLKVLLMSGYPSDMVEHEIKLSAKTDFLQKPFHTEELLKRIRSILDKKKASE